MSSTIKTSEVFVAGRTPTYTYNPRNELQLEDRLNDYLEDGGDILSLLGPTKTGKTVLLRSVLKNEDRIWIDGQRIKSIDDLWEITGSMLGVYFGSASSEQSGTTTSYGAKAEAFVFSAGHDSSKSSGQTYNRSYVRSIAHIVPQSLLESGKVLVIDDFHFVDTNVQKEVVQAVKPLIHEGLRVIFAAITHRRHDINTVVEDMNGRVKSIETSVWSQNELGFIASQGFEKLNLIGSDPIISKLAEMSFGSPHIMQQLCRELVRSVNGIRQAQETPFMLQPPSSWEDFFRKQYKDWSSGQWFIRLLEGPKEKGAQRKTWTLNNGSYELDNYGLVLKAIADSGPALELTRDQIRAGIERVIDSSPPQAHQITRALNHMSKIAASRLGNSQLSVEELDDQNAEFGGVQPVLDFLENAPIPTVHIADPFFAYFLKWGADDYLSGTTEVQVSLF